MAITTKLELRQTHNLVMTPQLQQAIKLLQLSNIELASFVEAELERNPLLEHAEPDETGSAAGEPAAASSKEDGAESSGVSGEGEAEAGDGDDGEWVDLEAGSGRTEDLDAEPQDVFPDVEGFCPGVLKDSGWSSLG